MTLFQSFHRYLAKNNIRIESGSNDHLLMFKQGNMYYAYVYDENKPYYFRLILPNIVKYNGHNDAELNKYALKLSTDYMVAKLIVADDKIWGAFEQIILDPDVNNDEIYKMGIRILGKIYHDINTFVKNPNMVITE